MKKQRSQPFPALIIPTLACALALAACSRGESRQVTENESASVAGYPQRLSFSGPLPQETAPVQPEGGAWRLAGASLRFTADGAGDLMALDCTHGADGTALLRVTRMTRAEQGAKALFALIGNGHIARLPVDVIRAGEPGEWQGQVPARDEQLDVLKGGNRIEATLPGGGTLKLPASIEPGRMLAACRASDLGPKDPGQPA
jgi:hypothetical protein